MCLYVCVYLYVVTYTHIHEYIHVYFEEIIIILLTIKSMTLFFSFSLHSAVLGLFEVPTPLPKFWPYVIKYS